jgi:hypothetical protein
MSFTIAAIPSDSVTPPAKSIALLKPEYKATRIAATTENGISSSRVIYRSIIFKSFCYETGFSAQMSQ